MAKKGKRQDAQHGITGAQRRKRVPLVAEGLSPRNRARALIRLHELTRYYDEVNARVKAKVPVGSWADPDDDELQTDFLDLAATSRAIKDLATQIGVRPQEQTEDTLRLIGEVLDGSHRRGKRRE